MSDEERLIISALVRAYKQIAPFDIEGQLKQMNKIFDAIDKMILDRQNG